MLQRANNPVLRQPPEKRASRDRVQIVHTDDVPVEQRRQPLQVFGRQPLPHALALDGPFNQQRVEVFQYGCCG